MLIEMSRGRVSLIVAVRNGDGSFPLIVPAWFTRWETFGTDGSHNDFYPSVILGTQLPIPRITPESTHLPYLPTDANLRARVRGGGGG